MSFSGDDIKTKIKGLNINEKTDINILLIGETGVGKSTLINSIANYLTYTDLKTAKKENLLVLIPSLCEVKDKNDEYHVIPIGNGEDKNEFLDTGVSATQDVKTYVFPIWGGSTKVRLIDTPGMGDTRGIEQDNINCENILSYIGQLHELHAICFLFKPTNPRITAFFQYCMDQILSRLDKSASNNLIFVFTNTRGTDYGPGETLPILQKIVKDIKDRSNIQIPVNRNIFCFDNEAFRYLAAIKHKVEFEKSIKERNNESWDKSVEQCWKLINYIMGDKDNKPLKPHFVKSTNAINEARRMITQLSQPLAEISQLINDNVTVLQRHQEHLKLGNQTLGELKTKLFMPVINLKVEKLQQPVTVCTSRECADIYKVGDINKWHYKQRCHNPCHLRNVPKEIIGSPELIHCAAINQSTRLCRRCNCDFSIHMHVYYMTETTEDHIVDPNVQKNINNRETVLENAAKLIGDCAIKKIELEKEHQIVVTCCARFAHFLQNNAITAFTDSYKEYIEYLINRERSLGIMSNMATVHHLEKLMREYEEAKRSFDKARELNKTVGKKGITAKQISDSIQELYNLKHNGNKIKELLECQKNSRQWEHKNSEYVHTVTSKKDDKKKDKKKDNKQPQPNPRQIHKGHPNQQRGPQPRQKSPPPTYQDLSHNYTSLQPGPYLPKHSGPELNPLPSPHGPEPYPYKSTAGYREPTERVKNDSTFKVIVQVNQRESNTREPYHPRESYPPRERYSPRESYPSRVDYPPRERDYGRQAPSSHGHPQPGGLPQPNSNVPLNKQYGARAYTPQFQPNQDGGGAYVNRERGNYRGGRGQDHNKFKR